MPSKGTERNDERSGCMAKKNQGTQFDDDDYDVEKELIFIKGLYITKNTSRGFY